MSLHQGCNIVTDSVEQTAAEMAALEFFRELAADNPIDTSVTVTRLAVLPRFSN
jgi:hypothetical protein